MVSVESLPKNISAGSLHLEWKRCGRACCRCTKGLLHGPYVYWHRRQCEKQKKTYVAMQSLGKRVAELEALKLNLPRPSMMRKALKENRV